MSMWIWIPILVALLAGYMVSYILLRTSGDGRSAIARLLHPGDGGLQEEYGGDGHGRPAVRPQATTPVPDDRASLSSATAPVDPDGRGARE